MTLRLAERRVPQNSSDVSDAKSPAQIIPAGPRIGYGNAVQCRSNHPRPSVTGFTHFPFMAAPRPPRPRPSLFLPRRFASCHRHFSETQSTCCLVCRENGKNTRSVKRPRPPNLHRRPATSGFRKWDKAGAGPYGPPRVSPPEGWLLQFIVAQCEPLHSRRTISRG
jgi:hypothetical protein